MINVMQLFVTTEGDSFVRQD